jgi:hypothetical protein
MISKASNNVGYEPQVWIQNTSFSETTKTESYIGIVNGTIDIGVLSRKDVSFFRQLQAVVDNDDNVARCRRYGFTYDNSASSSKPRRIFYGALIANEPWELFEVVSAETYGIYSAMVFVEGNRTQNFEPRSFQRLDHAGILARLFGVQPPGNVQVRAFVNEDTNLRDLDREHRQRDEILKGWAELGMQPDDVGLLADSDESFTRDFLRAVQVCSGIDLLDYETNQCKHDRIKLMGNTRVFETSPECITKDRSWYHPDMVRIVIPFLLDACSGQTRCCLRLSAGLACY